MESPPLARYTPHKSKKRVFPGSSSSCMDADVVEISPPSNWGSKSKSLKGKEVGRHEVIDVDMDEDSSNCVMLSNGEAETISKGKNVSADLSLGPGIGTIHGPAEGFKISKDYGAGSHSAVNLDDFGSDTLYTDEDYGDMCYDDLTYDDDYAFLQSHFDNMDIPTNIEVSIPWLSCPVGQKVMTPDASTSTCFAKAKQSEAANSPLGLDSLHTSGSSSALGNQSKKLELDPLSSVESILSKKRSAAASGSTPSFLGCSHPQQKPCVPCSRDYYGPDFQLSARNHFSHSLSSKSGNGSLVKHSRGTKPLASKWLLSDFPNMTTAAPPGLIAKASAMSATYIFSGEQAFASWYHDPANGLGAALTDSSMMSSGSATGRGQQKNIDEILEKFNLFKKFDTVEDHSDHHYSRSGSSVKQPSKGWAKKIQDEWKILEKDLPDAIFVRVYESRMDLLRAVIVGAEGTPYHDGLFFFDVFFPCSYPNVPPQVYYHSGGLRINPNLYNNGKVCLSLLNTWSGGQKEKWIPGVSTMLQVLVSIQGLILNAKPYFNEPGYASMSGSPAGERQSLQYNENAFILSLKTMVYTMRRPPKYFEDFVAGHFCQRAHDILVACKAYMDGAQVGCLVKGGIQDVDEGDRSCSPLFKDNLAGFVSTLVNTFTEIGAKDSDKFLYLAQRGNKLTLGPPSLLDAGFY